jgi:hypothetical protein
LENLIREVHKDKSVSYQESRKIVEECLTQEVQEDKSVNNHENRKNKVYEIVSPIQKAV